MSQYSGFSLREIYIQRCKELECKINSDLLSSLSDTPDDFRTMETLDISRNFLGPKGFLPLLDVIECCTALKVVDLRQQQLNKTAIEKICFVLRRHPSVTCVDLSDNPINISCGSLLLQLAKDNQNIENIILERTLVRQAMMTMIVSQLVRNRDTKLAKGLLDGFSLAGSGYSAVASFRSSSLSYGDVSTDQELSQRRKSRATHRAPPYEVKAILDSIPRSVNDVLFDANPVERLASMCSMYNYWFNDVQFAQNDSACHFIATREYGVARWRRVQELFPGTTMFPSEAHKSEINKGNVSFTEGLQSPFSWIFTCVTACLHNQRELEDVFVIPPEGDRPIGIYGARFFIDGKWRYLFVDDFLPVDINDQLVFARLGGDESFFWPCILEKMLAKLYGGYHMLKLSSPDVVSDGVSDASVSGVNGNAAPTTAAASFAMTCKRPTCARTMADLTAGLHVTVKLSDPGTDEDEKIWETMVDVLWTTSNAGASVTTQMVAISKSVPLSGIDANAAYNVLQARQLHGFRLVQLLCNTSQTRWKGDWAEESSLWTHNAEVKQVLLRTSRQGARNSSEAAAALYPMTTCTSSEIQQQRASKKGAFWMSFADFSRAFVELHLCRNLNALPERRQESEWGIKSSGGPVSCASWYRNPHFRLRVKERGPFVIHVSLPDRRFCENAAEQTLGFHILQDSMYPIGFPVQEQSRAPTTTGQERHLDHSPACCIYRSGYSRTDSITLERVLEPGEDYWIIPSCYTPGQTGKFVIRIFSYRGFVLSAEKLEDHWHAQTVEDVITSSGELRYGEGNSQVALSVGDAAAQSVGKRPSMRPSIAGLSTLRCTGAGGPVATLTQYGRIVILAEVLQYTLPEKSASAPKGTLGSPKRSGRRRVTFDLKKAAGNAGDDRDPESEVSMAVYITKGEVQQGSAHVPDRTMGLIDGDNVLGESLYVLNPFVFAECETSPGELCNIICTVQPPGTRATMCYRVWCTLPVEPLRVLPQWKKQTVYVEWNDEAGSGTYHSADNHPQVEVFPVCALDRFVFRMRVFDCSCTQPAVSLSVIKNSGRRGEKWHGNIPLDMVLMRSVYVRENWVQCEVELAPEENFDSVIVVPCLQPAGSMGCCALDISSEFGEFNTQILAGARPDFPDD